MYQKIYKIQPPKKGQTVDNVKAAKALLKRQKDESALRGLGFVQCITGYSIKVKEEQLEGTFYIFDAFGLALFVDVGIYKTLMMGYPMWVAIIMGTITGSMGGVLRDIFINEVPLVFRREIYATACIAGGVVYWLIGLAGGASIVQQTACAVLVILLRFFAVKHNWSFPAMHN